MYFISGEPDKNVFSINHIGDINGDGEPDFMIKSPSDRVYVGFGITPRNVAVPTSQVFMITGFSEKVVDCDTSLDEESVTDSAVEPFNTSLARLPIKKSMTV